MWKWLLFLLFVGFLVHEKIWPQRSSTHHHHLKNHLVAHMLVEALRRRVFGAHQQDDLKRWQVRHDNYHTVDGRNPAPVDMENLPLFAGLYVCHVVQDFFHQQYHNHTRIYNGYTALVRHVAPKLALSFPRNHLHSQHFEGKIYTFTLCNLIMETGCCSTVVTVSLSKQIHITSHNTQKGYKIATDCILHQQMSCPFQT